MAESTTIPAPRYREALVRLRDNIGKVIRGKEQVIDQILIALAAGGHVLLEDLPGLGKTTLAYTLARSIEGSFSRIQFTSDLLPSDVIGVSVYDESQKAFSFKKGPIFANIVLADEINRTTPKTQSSLLEVMDRAKVSVDGETYTTGHPFMVFATQNPVDFEGTFALPESQMDRFLMRLQMGYAEYEDELDILRSQHATLAYDTIQIASQINRSEIQDIQRAVDEIYLEDSVAHYILQLVRASREHPEVAVGASTRGTLALKRTAQAAALYEGRTFVIPEDVRNVVEPVLAHRLRPRHGGADPLEERRAAESIVHQLLQDTPQPG